jgi:hypothetical protein
MKKKLMLVLMISLFVSTAQKSFAWGSTGHGLVAKIAFNFLDDSTKKKVQDYLGKLTIEEAANWMDDSKSNSYYNYMRTWHYLDMDKGEKYNGSAERNILTVMHTAITNLKQYKTMKKKEVRYELLLLFHLIGDMHQPLHCGYAIDKGGNSIEISSPVVSGNLHSVWDTQILEYKKINLDSCLELYNTYDSATIAGISKINELDWMYQSRSYLDTVYGFENNFLDMKYIDNNILVIKRQLLAAGLRLASVLRQTFKS